MIDFDYSFFIEVLIGGLLSGVMYSLVAIGFVLIYKTSGVLNFAQGSMVLFAALTFVGLLERGAPFFVSLAMTLVVMAGLAVAVERAVLRPLVNKPPDHPSFMATLGLAYILEAFRAASFGGTQVHGLDLGFRRYAHAIRRRPWSALFDLLCGVGVAATMVVLLSIFFSLHQDLPGLCLSDAVADDQFAALAVGLRLPVIWRTVWTAAGCVALVAGLLWGARLGVQFSLSLIVLKALPVLVLGGFDSILGAIVGGLIVGATEKLAEVYIGPFFGGGIEVWFAYVVALICLLVRPAGLFGVKLVERA